LEKINISKHKNFCPLPWMHLYKDTDHSVKLCCADRGEPLGDLSKNTFEEIKNNDEFIKIRKQFLNDERPERCKDCWISEDNNRHSLRTSNLHYTKTSPYYNEFANDNINYLDFRTSNLCNLGCKICMPHFSSKLAEAWDSEGLILDDGSVYRKGNKEYYTSFHKRRVKFNDIGNILSPDLSRVYFAGGEPLLSDEHWTILDNLKEHGLTDISLMYNTNFTLLTYKGKDLLDYVKDFKEVELCCSLDGIGESFDYWRTGGKWETILKNLDRVKEFRDSGYPNVILGVTSAVGWMNFKEVFKLHKFLVEEGYLLVDETASRALQMQPVYGLGVSFEYTPPLIREEILEIFDEYEQWRDSTFDKKFGVLDNITMLRNLVKNSEFNIYNFISWVQHNKSMDNYFGTELGDQYSFKNKEFLNIIKDIYSTKGKINVRLTSIYESLLSDLTLSDTIRKLYII